MTTHRSAYIAIFVISALLAAALYYVAQPRADVVRARTDIAVLTPISADMLELVRVSPGDRPAEAATSIEAVVGQYAAMPILAGQFVDTRALESTPGSRAFGFGAPLPAGYVAFALAVEPAQAVGGALSPGALVDVVAVPNALKTLSSTDAPPQAVVLGKGLVVLALRTGDGQTLTAPSSDPTRSAALPPKLASVVVAIPADELPRFATAALTSTIYLGLSPPGDGDRASP